MKTRVLITGFEPFNGARLNPSAELIRDLKWLSLNAELSSVLLPVDYKAAWPTLEARLTEIKPDVIIQLGQASGRSAVSLERVAINWKQEKGGDTGGDEQVNGSSPGEKIVLGAPDAIFSTLPLDKMLSAGIATNVRSEISNSAGTYLCNYVFFKTMLTYRFSPRLAGFIHLPLLPEQVDADSEKSTMRLADMKKCLSAMIDIATKI